MCILLFNYVKMYDIKVNEIIRNGQRDITVKPTEKQLREQNDAKYSKSENKSDNYYRFSFFISIGKFCNSQLSI